MIQFQGESLGIMGKPGIERPVRLIFPVIVMVVEEVFRVPEAKEISVGWTCRIALSVLPTAERRQYRSQRGQDQCRQAKSCGRHD